jgi:hypothetical protein
MSMTGLWLALSLTKTVSEIHAVVEAWFPKLNVLHWDWSSKAQVDQAINMVKANILFRLEHNQSEFPTLIHFDAFPGLQDEAHLMPTMIELGRKFAETFGCRTICDGSGYGDDQSPYWAIVWDSGKSFLTDDCGTLFADHEGGRVKTIRELHLPLTTLDSAGHLVLR